MSKEEEVYDNIKRMKAGIKRLIKVCIPLIPQAIAFVGNYNIPYKNTIMVLLAGIIALEKALQKDKNKK